MIRMFARRLHNTTVAIGADRIIFGLSLPSGSRINDISLDVRLHQDWGLDMDKMVMYAVEGWILPILDPDSAVNLNTLWDNLVPKDTDVESIDLDSVAADATPFYEPGEPDWSDMFEVGLRPERVYHTNRMLTIEEGSVFTAQDNQTPFAPLWMPGAVEKIRVRQNYSVSQPSVLVFAVANPSLDDTTATELTAASENEWGQLKYIGHVLERAMLHLFGVTEAGAETPWEEATALLKKQLEPDPFEEASGNMASVAWRTMTKSIVDYSVVGRLEDMTISSGR